MSSLHPFIRKQVRFLHATLIAPCLFGKRSGGRGMAFMMSDSGGMDHIQRTADNTRDGVISQATVVDTHHLSATVKALRLKVHDKQFNFKAGQWVDVTIPGVDTVGGYSMTSSPGLLKREGVLDLAIKYSNHPPAYWVHTECKHGSEVSLRVGGDFYFDPPPEDNLPPVLLLAGGVGINPLYSMINHVVDLEQTLPSAPPVMRLLYSARSEEELVFKSQLIAIQEHHVNISCHFFVTREKSADPLLTCSRIDQGTVKGAIQELARLSSYVCGPSPMIESMEQTLSDLGVKNHQIHCEKWW